MLFQRGDTGTAVRASSAVPGVFSPVAIAGRNMSTAAWWRRCRCSRRARWRSEFVIAVNISSPPDGNATSDTFKVLMQTFDIMG